MLKKKLKKLDESKTPMSEIQVQQMIEEINRVAPFAKVDAYDVRNLQPVPFCHKCGTSTGKMYTLRAGAWLIAINWHSGYNGNDSYAVAQLVEISF